MRKEDTRLIRLRRQWHPWLWWARVSFGQRHGDAEPWIDVWVDWSIGGFSDGPVDRSCFNDRLAWPSLLFWLLLVLNQVAPVFLVMVWGCVGPRLVPSREERKSG